jgi:pilus assembly protein Flp/PilA
VILGVVVTDAMRPPLLVVCEARHTIVNRFSTFVRSDEGQGLVEYALIIALVSIVAIVALQFLGKNASNSLNSSAGYL